MIDSRFMKNKEAAPKASMERTVFILRVRVLVFFFCVGIMSYIALVNQMPFGAKRSYSLKDKSIPDLSPASRVEKITVNGEEVTKQKNDLIYFTTKYPFNFDKAVVRVRFKSPGENQRIEMGFKDKSIWHYHTQVIDLPFMHSEGWEHVGRGPTLYQRSAAFDSVNQFFEDYPAKTIVGTVEYAMPKENIELTDYIPQETLTVIDTPLRGQHVMHVYLQDEPFYMKVSKRDLNWYDDPDVLEIRVYKEDTLVFTAVVDDDGITDDSASPGILEEVEIRNPGPDLPEPGVYKIVFDTSEDVLITGIETNLHKIVLAGRVYAAGNSTVYSPVTLTSTTTLYTNSRTLALTTAHDAALQSVSVNGSTTPLRERGVFRTITASSSGETSKIIIPKSDAVVEGAGYYAFSAEQFFLPSQFNTMPIYSNKDAELADYIISSYKPHEKLDGGYYEAEREFDLATAVPNKNKLSWIIRAPGLKEADGEVEIKDIEIEYTKKGWFEESP
jgi:hypothetical protein